MGNDVDIPLESMQELSDALALVISEYKDAADRTDTLLDAIDEPLGDSRLRYAAEGFEEKWNDKRDTQRGNLEEMKKRLDESREAWEQLDRELAQAIEGES